VVCDWCVLGGEVGVFVALAGCLLFLSAINDDGIIFISYNTKVIFTAVDADRTALARGHSLMSITIYIGLAFGAFDPSFLLVDCIYHIFEAILARNNPMAL